MDNACVIGYGVVGKATASVFGIDKYFDLLGSTITLKEAAKLKFIFLCLPTPIKDGNYDLSAIESTIKQLTQDGFGGIFINRSTVNPGAANHFQHLYNIPIVANPEFLDEKTAEYDVKHPTFVVLGADLPGALKAVKGIYEARFKGTDYIETDTVTAETIKLAVNTFFATKVVFANQIYEVCNRIGANYESIKEALEKHKYGSRNHFTIWHNEGRGAGGRCLSKDVQAFSNFAGSELVTLVNRINQDLLAEYPKHG